MMKFIVGIALVGFTTYCGIFLSKKYKVRKTFFEEAYAFNTSVLEELNFTKRPFEEFYQKRSFKGEFSGLLMEEHRRRNLKKTLPLELEKYSFLNVDEKRFFAEYLSTLGRGDTVSQKAFFSRAGDSLQSFKIKAIEECKKYVDLYTKMGFLLGLAILIILI